jgi:hypothetical protein
VSQTAERRPGPGAAIQSNDRAGRGQGSARRGPLVAVGIWYPPAGRRRLGAIVVRTCPRCSYLHLHRSAGPVTSTTRQGSCGAEYTIRVARVGGVA